MQQAITWANVDPDLYRRMASLNENELTKDAQSYVVLCSFEELPRGNC